MLRPGEDCGAGWLCLAARGELGAGTEQGSRWKGERSVLCMDLETQKENISSSLLAT